MKFTFAAEDTLMGIICGLLLISYTGSLFSLKLSDFTYVIIFGIYILFIFLDIINELRDLTTHFGFIMFSLLHSIIDLIISLTVISSFSKWNIPYITSNFAGLMQNQTTIFWAGIFLVVGNSIWLIMWPFLD